MESAKTLDGTQLSSYRGAYFQEQIKAKPTIRLSTLSRETTSSHAELDRRSRD
jgi:hypothetical protein